MAHLQSQICVGTSVVRCPSVRAGTHWWRRRKSTKPKANKVADFRLCCRIFANLSPICRRFVAVNVVAKFEHVQLGRLCRKWVIFVAWMSNVLSTLSPVCTGPIQSHIVDLVDFRQSRLRRVRLCRLQFVPRFSASILSWRYSCFRGCVRNHTSDNISQVCRTNVKLLEKTIGLQRIM